MRFNIKSKPQTWRDFPWFPQQDYFREDLNKQVFPAENVVFLRVGMNDCQQEIQ